MESSKNLQTSNCKKNENGKKKKKEKTKILMKKIGAIKRPD